MNEHIIDDDDALSDDDFWVYCDLSSQGAATELSTTTAPPIADDCAVGSNPLGAFQSISPAGPGGCNASDTRPTSAYGITGSPAGNHVYMTATAADEATTWVVKWDRDVATGAVGSPVSITAAGPEAKSIVITPDGLSAFAAGYKDLRPTVPLFRPRKCRRSRLLCKGAILAPPPPPSSQWRSR